MRAVTEQLSVRVLIAEDFALVRSGIERVLEAHPQIEVVGVAADGLEAVSSAAKLRPDVVVLDLRMSGHGGMEALDSLTEQFPEVKVLVLTANENPANVRAALAGGAAGYLTKHVPADELCAAVIAVDRGAVVVTPSLAAHLHGENGEPTDGVEQVGVLTIRQRKIVRLVSEGRTDGEIAELLFISPRTVQYEVAEIKRRAGLQRRSEIARWAVIHSLG